MNLIVILIVIAVVGFLVYLVNTEVQMPPVYRKIFNVVAAVGLIVWVLHRLGAWHYLNSI